jgi:hypothetical protein
MWSTIIAFRSLDLVHKASELCITSPKAPIHNESSLSGLGAQSLSLYLADTIQHPPSLPIGPCDSPPPLSNNPLFTHPQSQTQLHPTPIKSITPPPAPSTNPPTPPSLNGLIHTLLPTGHHPSKAPSLSPNPCFKPSICVRSGRLGTRVDRKLKGVIDKGSVIRTQGWLVWANMRVGFLAFLR